MSRWAWVAGWIGAITVDALFWMLLIVGGGFAFGWLLVQILGWIW